MSTGLDALYQEIILEHSKARHGAVPPGSGVMTAEIPAGAAHAESHQMNPVCGDEITVRVDAVGDEVAGMVWDGVGCAISMASASVLSDLLKGLSRAEAQELIGHFRQMLRSRGQASDGQELVELLGEAAAFAGVARYVARVKCAMLAWVAFEAALMQLESGTTA